MSDVHDLHDIKRILSRNTDSTDDIEREMFWREKRRYIDTRTPTGYFEQPVFQTWRGFGRVETQFVSDPFYIEVENAPTGYLRDAYGRSLNPDTFHRVFSDSKLSSMRSGKSHSLRPKSIQETRLPILTGAAGYKKNFDLQTRIRALHEPASIKEHSGAPEKLANFKHKHGIFNSGETALFEKTGLGTLGTHVERQTPSPRKIVQDLLSAKEEKKPMTIDTSFITPHGARRSPTSPSKSSSSSAASTPTRKPIRIELEESPQSLYGTPMNEPAGPSSEKASSSGPSPFKSILRGMYKDPATGRTTVLNPKTNRNIAVDGAVYKALRAEFHRNGGKALPAWKYTKTTPYAK